MATSTSLRRSSRRSTRSTISISRLRCSATSRFGFYLSGHMVYLHPPALAQFHDDLERWYARGARACVSSYARLVAALADCRARRRRPAVRGSAARPTRPMPLRSTRSRSAARRIPIRRAPERSRSRTPRARRTARIFYTAFTLDGADPRTRPVTFFYNGGPGSSTIWLRMGSFGPVRVQVGDGTPTRGAPFNLVENQYSLLDRTRSRLHRRAGYRF